MRNPLSFLPLLIVLCSCEGPDDADFSRPLTPEEAVADFRVDSLFRVEVFAAEPFVRDPVDLAFDEYGRVYVAEMLDYPFEDRSAPGSRIRMLADNDGDGRVDDAVLFADNLQLVSGIQPWNGGLIVTAAPDILFLRDADGDGRADERQTLFTGFAEANAQHRIATPRFAIDNWIYVANDGAPGTIRPVLSPNEAPLSVLGTDFRFRMPVGDESIEYEAASGPAQFGQAFDAYGRRFITHNTVHVRHVVLPRAYFRRNPYLRSATSALDVSDHGLRVYQTSAPQAWRVSRSESRQRRYDAEGVDRTEQRADVFTAVAGAAITGEGAYPADYHGNLFSGETAANLVHRDVLTPAGPTFEAARAEGETEFLTATDPWFRPANVVVGPDGYLYVVDMYRAIIESPEYIPESLRQNLEFRRGTEYGRIYRIVPRNRSVSGGPPVVADPLPSQGLAAVLARPNPTRSLAALLADRNPWTRLTAHRLLLERGDRSVAADLEELARNPGAPYARLHALYVLDGLGVLSEDVVAHALDDPHAGVREHALRFAESYPVLGARTVALAADASPRVRMQAALTLGSIRPEIADSALVRIAVVDGDDPWFATAILSTPPDRTMMLLEGLLREEQASARLVEDLASVVGARGDEEEIAALITLAHAGQPARREAVLSGLAEGFDLRGFRRLEMPRVRRSIRALLDETGDPARQSITPPDEETVERAREAALGVARHLLMPELAARALRDAVDGTLPSARRAAAAENLVTGRLEDVEAALVQLLQSGDPRLQAAALQSIRSFDEVRLAAIVLQAWSDLAPALKSEAAGALSTRHLWVIELLEALEADRIESGLLPMDVRLRLLDHPDASIRRRAATILDRPSPEVSTAVLALESDAGRGREVFYRECARCHAAGGIGPDLVGVSNKSGEQLLEAVTAPSSAIPATYAAYVAVLADGAVVSGRIVREMPGTLTFRSESTQRTVLRTDIRDLRTASRSLMPDGYGIRLDHQELADLVAFLKAGTDS